MFISFPVLQGWALANPQRSSNLCALRGWVVSEPFDVVHSLQSPPFCCITCIVKKYVWGFQGICSLNLFWMQISFPFVDIKLLGNHALCCPDIRNWCPYWFLVHIFLAFFFYLLNFFRIKVVTEFLYSSLS